MVLFVCIHGRNRHSRCMMCSGLSIRFFVYFAYVVSDPLNQSEKVGRERRQAHAGTLGLGKWTDSGKGQHIRSSLPSLLCTSDFNFYYGYKQGCSLSG